MRLQLQFQHIFFFATYCPKNEKKNIDNKKKDRHFTYLYSRSVLSDEKILYLNQFVTYVTAHIVITNITTYLMQEQIIFKMQSSIVLKQTNQFT